MLHRSWTNGDETFYLIESANMVGTEKWKSLQQYGVENTHAILEFDPARSCYWLRDISTKSAVRVNGIPISKTESVRIKTGDHISFGHSPEYAFFSTPTSTPPSMKSVSGYHSRSRSQSRRHCSSDENGENVGYSNLAVDSAPSVVNNACVTSSRFNSLPRLNRGRSPALHHSVNHLPVATMIDGRVIDAEVENGPPLMVSRSYHCPNVITYRHRQFLRQVSTDSNARNSPPIQMLHDGKRKATPIAWEDSNGVKEIAASSASSCASFAGTTRRLTQHKTHTDTYGNSSIQTYQAHIIEQLQKRVQQLEEALNVKCTEGDTIGHGGDSGMSSAASAQNTGKELGHSGTDTSEKQHSDSEAHYEEECDRNLNQSHGEKLINEKMGHEGYTGPVEDSAAEKTLTSDEESAAKTEAHSQSMKYETNTDQMQLESTTRTKTPDNNDKMVGGETPVEVPIEREGSSAVPHDGPDENETIQEDTDAPSKYDWQQVLNEEGQMDEEPYETNNPTRIAAEAGADVNNEQATEDGPGLRQELSLQQCRIEAILRLQHYFVEEIATIPALVLSDPLYDYSQLTAHPLEFKIEWYKVKLTQAMADGAFQLNDELCNSLCAWAVDKCLPMIEATHRLMPTVVSLLKRRGEDYDAQKILESWFNDFKMHCGDEGVNKKGISESMEMLGIYVNNYWQKDLIMAVLKFIVENERMEPKLGASEKSDCSVNTDISHEDFSKLVSDIADLLDEKEQFRVAKTNLQNELQTKHNESDDLCKQMDVLNADLTLLKEDNRNLMEAKRELTKRMEEVDRAREEMEKELKSQKELDTTMKNRLLELEHENERLVLELVNRKDPNGQGQPQPQYVTNQQIQQDESGLDYTSPSAREELEYLKRKLAELGECSAVGPDISKEALHQECQEHKVQENENMQNGKDVGDDTNESPKPAAGNGNFPIPGGGLQSDNMFWSLSEKLGSILDSNNGTVTTHSEDELLHQNETATAQQILEKVKILMNRVKQQNEELASYRSAHGCDGSGLNGHVDNPERQPHECLSSIVNGNAPVEHIDNEKNGHTHKGRADSKVMHRKRSSSVKLLRGRSPSPHAPSIVQHTIPGTTLTMHGGRECHACDILKARRKQQEILQAAKTQAAGLAINRHLESYPMKVVTFKLPHSTQVPAGKANEVTNENIASV